MIQSSQQLSRPRKAGPRVVFDWRIIARTIVGAALGLPLLIAATRAQAALPSGAPRELGIALAALICIVAMLQPLSRTREPLSTAASTGYPADGPNRTAFGPVERIGRTRGGTLACILLVVLAFAWSPAERTALPWSMLVLGLVIGYASYRRRSPRRWLQITLRTVLPILLALLFVNGSLASGSGVIALALLPAAELGTRLAIAVDRIAGPRPKVLRASWAGVAAVGSATHPGEVVFDVRPLAQPVSRVEARRFTAGTRGSSLRWRAALLRAVFFVCGPIMLIALLFGFNDEGFRSGPDASSQLLAFSAVASLLVLGYAIIGWFGIRAWRHQTSARDHVRFARFAEANRLHYAPGPLGDKFGRELTRVLTTSRGRDMLLANAVQGAAANERSAAPITQFSGVCEFSLAVPLPHLLLIARRPRLPAFSAHRAPRRDQRLSLEGDFDRYFDLFCPRGYETDALYLFTPDVMSRLIDGVHEFDVEIIDDRVTLRSRRDLVTIDPGTWQSIAVAVNALNDRIVRWERWRDGRFGAASEAPLLLDRPAGVASRGRRLRGSLSLGFALIIGYGVVFTALTLIANAS